LRRRLLRWYRRRGRELPWRETTDPYRVWVSEVMLQQTQVAAATPFYQRFIGRFPTLMSLARAREAQVLALWSGLGYYRRARHLLAAARHVARTWNGVVPDDPERFGSLPGVGRYTTGAVLSIAFGRRLPVVDGNVARVLSRLFATRASLQDPAGSRTLWRIAESLVPMRRPGDWNQALMELGATLCVPQRPLCTDCPVRVHCGAYAAGRVGDFPAPRPRRKAVAVRRALALVERRGRLLVRRREGPLMNGLWEPPGVDLAPGEAAGPRLAAELARIGCRAPLRPMDGRVKHAITYRRIEVELWRGPAASGARPPSGARFIDPRRPAVAITGLTRKVARRLG
jgi:A/G-specific adenine glycosylase